MYSRFLKCNESNKILVLNTLINSLDCEVILNLYKPNNLNLYFPLSYETSKYFKEIFDEIIYEDIFCGGMDYSPSILENFKKHGAENFARKLAKKDTNMKKEDFTVIWETGEVQNLTLNGNSIVKREIIALVSAADLKETL